MLSIYPCKDFFRFIHSHFNIDLSMQRLILVHLVMFYYMYLYHDFLRFINWSASVRIDTEFKYLMTTFTTGHLSTETYTNVR